MEEQKKYEEQLAEVRMEEQKKYEGQVFLLRLLKQAQKARLEEQKKWKEQLAKAWTEEQKKCEETTAKITQVKTELAVVRQELADKEEAMPKCAICFESLETNGTMAKCGKKRSRNDVVQRKRACFTLCMHSSMCLDCAVAAWKKFKRCPVCSTTCSSKPQPIFL